MDALEHEARRAAWRADPEGWLRDALRAIAAAWQPEQERLLFGGAGAGTGWLRGALRQLTAERGPLVASEVAHAAWRALEHPATAAVGDVLHRELSALPPPVCAGSCCLRFAARGLRKASPRPGRIRAAS